MARFCCPECGGYMYGSSETPGSDERTYHCSGNEEWVCDWSGTEEEFEACYLETHEEQLEAEVCRLWCHISSAIQHDREGNGYGAILDELEEAIDNVPDWVKELLDA